VEEREGKILLGRTRRRWEDIIKMDPRDIEWGGVGKGRDNWRALVNAVMNFRIP
jgi:hypothetical protein